MRHSTLLGAGLLAALGNVVSALPAASAPSVEVILPREVKRDEPIRLAPVKNPNRKGSNFRKIIDVKLKEEEHFFFESDGKYLYPTDLLLS